MFSFKSSSSRAPKDRTDPAPRITERGAAEAEARQGSLSEPRLFERSSSLTEAESSQDQEKFESEGFAKQSHNLAQRSLARQSLITAALAVILTLCTALLLYYYTGSESIDLYSLLAPANSPLVVGFALLLLLFGLREAYLRRISQRSLSRQLAIISLNLDRLTRRIGLEQVNESGRGEVGMTTLLSDIRLLQEQLGSQAKVRGQFNRNHDLPEPLGLDRLPDKGFSLHKTVQKPSPTPPPELAVKPQDRVTIESVDLGDELSPTKAGISAEPVFKKPSSEATAVERLRAALAADQVELYLQPIVNLPQRRLCYHRCQAVIRMDNNEILEPEFYRPIATAAGMMAMIDNALLVRIIQLSRRLGRQKQPPALICPLSGDTLREREYFNDFRGFMRKNTELAPLLIFSIPQFVVDRLEPRVEEELVTLSKLGYRFVMSELQQFDFFVSDLSHKGFRFVEVEANYLFNHPLFADDPRGLKKLLDPGAIDLIVEGLDDEDVILDMLDFNLDYGRGKVFGEPASEEF
ncbi:MAG: EAL domain-containing protein [Candidatus Pacebacteria bacterium]|nr:EAL domain-containing protein [Candidatus Paceibacterota bacterium]